jgi:hypothetical protein
MEQARREAHALDDVRALLPLSLQAHCRRVLFSGTEVILFTEASVWATRLRFMAPEILRALARSHPGLRRCRVRVLPEEGDDRRHRPKTSRPRLSDRTARHLRAAADVIADPQLAAAMRRLASSGVKGNRSEEGQCPRDE